MTHKTVRLTMAQALVRYLCNQFAEIYGVEVPLFAGDTFASRLPDPVLQQVEHFRVPVLTASDAF